MRASVTHRTTTSAGRRGLPGAAVVAAAVALAGLLPAPAAGATTQTADACESVTALVAAALPGQALDLVAALRAGSPGPTGTTSGTTTTLGTDDAPVTVEESQSPASACATEAAVAAAAVDRAEERAREAVALVPTDARAARDAADEALAVDAENETAQRAKAAADTALAQPVAQVGGTWDAFVDRYVDPLGAPALAAALVLVVLLLLARALTGVTLYWPRLTNAERGAAAAAGGVALVLASVTLTTALATDVLDAGSVTCRLAGPCVVATWTWVLACVAVAVTALVVGNQARPVPQDRARRWWRALLGVGAWPVLLLPLVLAVLATRWLDSSDQRPSRALPAAGLAVAGVLLALLGAGLTATAVATRLRVTVEVTGADGADEAARTRVVAFVRELGAERPRGLETPLGADVDVLQGGVLGDLPTGKIATAVVGGVRALLGTTPWRVHVAAASDDRLSVVVTRNGRAAGSAVVDRHVLLQLVPDGTAPLLGTIDLHRGAAAVVVTTLSRHHDGFEGLCGTTSWRSLALHYVATTDLRTDDARRPLLAAAAELDPSSDLVQFALMHATLRESRDAGELEAYVAWLTEFASPVDEPRPGYEALQLRALYVRAAIAINHAFAVDPGATQVPSLSDYVEELERRLRAVGAADPGPAERYRGTGEGGGTAVQPRDARVGAGTGVATTTTSGPTGFATAREIHYATDALRPYADRAAVHAPRSPSARYNRACYLATLGGDPAGAVRELRLAAADPENATWMRADPQLERFRESLAYRREFGDEPAAFLDLAVLEPVRDVLRRAGVTDAAPLTAPVRRVSRRTGLRAPAAARARRVALLVQRAPAALDRVKHDVVDVLTAHGYETESAVPSTGAPAAALAAAVRSRLLLLRPGGEADDVDQWAAAVDAWLGLGVAGTGEGSGRRG